MRISERHFVFGNTRRDTWCRRLFVYPLVFLVCTSPVKIARAQTTSLAVISNLIQEGKLEQAGQQLRRYLLKSPHSARAGKLLATVYLRQGHYKQAKDVLQPAISRDPTLLDLRMTLGDVYLAEGNSEAAVTTYQQAKKIAPHDARVNLALAKVYLAAGDFANSIEAAGNIPVEKRSGELLPTLAADYFGLGQPEKAAIEIQGMLQIAEKDPELVPQLAEFFLAHRDFKSSQQLLSLAQAKQPNTERFLVDLALTDAGLGLLDEAQKILESILARTPESLAALMAAGQVASQQLDWAASAEAFSRANTISPDRPDILYGLALAQLYTNQLNEALANAHKLHSAVPDDLRSRYLMALALFGIKNWEQAKPYAEQVLKAHPDDREMNLILADIAYNYEHNFPAARKYVDICLQQNPKDPGALYYLGMIQKLNGDLEGAKQSLLLSVVANPRNSEAQGALGALCLQAGDISCAVRALEQAVQLSPGESQNHYELAIAYSRSNTPDQAKEQLQIYRQMKTREEQEAGATKGPSRLEASPMGATGHP